MDDPALTYPEFVVLGVVDGVREESGLFSESVHVDPVADGEGGADLGEGREEAGVGLGRGLS